MKNGLKTLKGRHYTVLQMIKILNFKQNNKFPLIIRAPQKIWKHLIKMKQA